MFVVIRHYPTDTCWLSLTFTDVSWWGEAVRSKNTSKPPTFPHPRAQQPCILKELPEHQLKGALQHSGEEWIKKLSLIASSFLGSLSSPCLFFLAFSERELFLCRSFSLSQAHAWCRLGWIMGLSGWECASFLPKTRRHTYTLFMTNMI